MIITIEAKVRETLLRYGNGKPHYHAYLLVNGHVISFYPCSRKTPQGARDLANRVAAERVKEELYFGNVVTLIRA